MFRWDCFFRADWTPAQLQRLRREREREFAASRLAFREPRTTKHRLRAASPNIAGHSIAKFHWKATLWFPGSTKRFRRWTSRAWMGLILTLCRGRRGKLD